MKFTKSAVLCAVVGALVLAAVPSAAMPPPPPGMQLAPGMVWCPRCGGHGRVPSGFLGLNDKRCPECKGCRMVRMHHHRGAPVPPPRHARPEPPPPPARPVPQPPPARPMPQPHHVPGHR